MFVFLMFSIVVGVYGVFSLWVLCDYVMNYSIRIYGCFDGNVEVIFINVY